MIKLTLRSHDEDNLNLANKFTGLTDVDPTNNRVKRAASVRMILQTLSNKVSIQKI